MAVKYYTEECDYRLPEKMRTARWLRAVAESEGFRLGAMNYIFCGSDHHRAMNVQYVGHDYYTDIITFDYTDYERRVASGDVFIDPETVEDNAHTLGTDPREEIYRVVVHGLLHLCGYKDKSPEEEALMHATEDKYLALRKTIE